MTEKVLISGGSGLVGRRLTQKLLEEGYHVRWLSRSNKNIDQVECFQWDVEKMEMDEKAVNEADYIIHLSGEGIADKRWNRAQKTKILKSRVDSTTLIKRALESTNQRPKAFICASGIGYYGYDNGGNWLKETSRFGDDFVAKVVKEWEASADDIANLGIRTAKLRTGIVLSERGGALGKMVTTVKLGLGAPLGSGDQYISWIHIDDMCSLYLYAIQNKTIEGTYNAVSQQPVTNNEFNKTLAKVLKKPYFMPAVPAFVLKLVLGDMASLVLGSGRVSGDKIVEAGYQLKYEELSVALHNLLTNS